MKKAIPNLLTMCNLMCGCFGIVWGFTSDIRLAGLAIAGSLFFDYADGFAARLLNAKSPIGKELDSLADLVSFGVVPSVIGYVLLRSIDPGFLTFMPFLLTIFSAYRLAKFNIDERQTQNFIGLPTPANAIFWASLPFIITRYDLTGWQKMISDFFDNKMVIVSLVLIFSFLMISEINLFSLKFQSASFKDNKHRYIFLFLCLVLLVSLQYYAIPFIILLYLIISFIHQKTFGKHEIQS